MKKIKSVLDIVMFIIMLLLMNTEITGLQTHEIMGIGIFIIFAIHKLLNIKWIKSIGKNIFNKNMNIKSKIQFLLDIILFVFVTANVISGILISKCILTEITFGNIGIVTVFHKFFAWWSLILISIHIGFHWKSIINSVSRKFTSIKDNTMIKIILKLLYVVIAIAGIISLLKKDIYTNLIPIIDDKNDNEHNRDFEDINNKSNSNKFDKEKEYKDRPSDSEYPEGERKNKGKNHNYDSNQDEDNDKKDSNINNNDNVQTVALTDDFSGGTPTLNEYLGKFNCSGCGRRCLLSNPRCGTGRAYQSEKIQEYNKLYGDNVSSSNEYDFSNLDELKNNNVKEITKANIKGISVIDYISIMGLFIGGTYYTIEIMDKNKKSKLRRLDYEDT